MSTNEPKIDITLLMNVYFLSIFLAFTQSSSSFPGAHIRYNAILVQINATSLMSMMDPVLSAGQMILMTKANSVSFA